MFKILHYPHPLLRQKAALITDFGEKWSKISQEMFETMDEYKGIGLAANQVGILDQIIVVGANIFFNPRFIPIGSSKSLKKESCLSIPGIEVEVARFDRISLEYNNVLGQRQYIRMIDGLMSRVIQHEISHLQGRLIIDDCSNKERLRIESYLKELENLEKEEKLLDKIFNVNEINN